MEVVCGIYCIENLINNKKYIGQSIDVYRRWINHKCDLNGRRHNNHHLQAAWDKYGCDNFEFKILEECLKQYLDEKEVYYINQYNCMNSTFGYNLESGGNLNKHPSDETRKKMSESHIGKQAGENNPSWGKPKSAETKKRISESKIGKYAGEKHPLYGTHRSDDTKRKISESRIGKRSGEDHPMYGERHSEEERKKISKNRGGKQIYCPELDKIFWGASEAEEKHKIDHTNIIACCRGKRKSAGKHPITQVPLHWEYVQNNNT